MLFRAAKHVFIWFVSLSRDKEMNITGCSVGWFVRSSFVCKRFLESNDRTANIVFLGKNLMFLFLVSEKGTEKSRIVALRASIHENAETAFSADLGATAPKYPAESRANADAPHRLIRTRLLNSKNFAFAASKRSAKIEKRSRVERQRFLVRLG